LSGHFRRGERAQGFRPWHVERLGNLVAHASNANMRRTS
jgi:hypothetical protein